MADTRTTTSKTSLPPELKTFPWDHSEDADALCVTCHDIKGQDSFVSDFDDSAPVCNTCHPSKENKKLVGGAPVVTFDKLKKAVPPKMDLSDTVYKEVTTAASKFAAYVGLTDTFRNNSGETPDELVTTAVTGADWRLKGSNVGLSARVAAFESYEPQTQSAQAPEISRAELGIRSGGTQSWAEASGGAISVFSPFGLLPLNGARGRVTVTGVSANAYVGQADWNNKLVYGGGLAVNRGNSAAQLFSTLDFVGQESMGQLVAAAAGGGFSQQGWNGSGTSRIVIDPQNGFQQVDRVENNFTISKDKFATAVQLNTRPAQSNDPFSGEPTYGNTVFTGSASYRVTDDFVLRSSYATGTFLPYDVDAAVTVDLAEDLLHVGAEAGTRREVMFGEDLDAKDITGRIGITEGPWSASTSVGYLTRDALPIFEGPRTNLIQTNLTAGYNLGSTTVGLSAIAYITGGNFEVSALQALFKFPLGKKIQSQPRSYSFAPVVSDAAKRDPDFYSRNPAIYPEQIFPDVVQMSHKLMVAAFSLVPGYKDNTCVVCHNETTSDDQMTLPDKNDVGENCSNCHMQPEKTAAKKVVHVKYDASEFIIPPAFLRKKHAVHLQASSNDHVCLECHVDMADVDVATRMQLAVMDTCLGSCHDQPVNVAREKIELPAMPGALIYQSLNHYLSTKNTSSECLVCHVPNDDGTKIAVETPNGLFFPQRDLWAHGERGTTTRENWFEKGRHGPVALAYGSKCNECHGQASAKACTDCHGTAETGAKRPTTHDEIGWKTDSHYGAALSRLDNSCIECHTPKQAPKVATTVCFSCHDHRSVTQDRKHTSDYRCDFTAANPENYHQASVLSGNGSELCTSCHGGSGNAATTGAIGCNNCHSGELQGYCE